MKIACLLIPHLPVQVERRGDPSLAQTPLIVGGRPWDEGAVLDCCPRAEAAGVEKGMRLSQAETLCPKARFIPADEKSYHAVHHALADAAKRFTPTVETAELGLLYADVSALKRRLPSDEGLAHRMMEEALAALRPCLAPPTDVRLGLAEGKFVAEQAARAARRGETCVVPPGEERAFLSPLPLDALPADPEMICRLHLLGVRTLGALANLPRLAVVRQFGAHAGPLHNLASGMDARPVHREAPPLKLSRSQTFNDPLSDRAPLLAYLERMVSGLASELDRRGYQAEGIRLELEEARGEEHAVGKPVEPPSSDAEKLACLAARLLGGIEVDRPIASLALTVYPLRPFHLGATQLTLFRGQADASTFSVALREALRRLRDRFGEMIITVASLLGPPSPHPVQVTTDRDGLPRAVVWRDRIWEVREVYELWRERRRWWGRPIERDYFRLELNEGGMRVVFRDVRTERWLLERRHI